MRLLSSFIAKLAATMAKAAAVDPLSGCGASAAVFQVSERRLQCFCVFASGLLTAWDGLQDENGVAWSFMLNYTNISFGVYGCGDR